MDVDDVCAILGVSKAYAYNLMREYNKELKAKGYIVVAGKISTKFLEEKIYGMKIEDQQWVFTKKERTGKFRSIIKIGRATKREYKNEDDLLNAVDRAVIGLQVGVELSYCILRLNSATFSEIQST